MPGAKIVSCLARLMILCLFAMHCTRVAEAADACDVIVARLVADQAVQFERRAEGGTIHLRHPLAQSLSIGCGETQRGPNIFVSWGGAYPTAAFYTFLGRIGTIVVGKSAAAIEAGAKRSHVAALESRDEQSEIRIGGLEFDCQVSTRNGGSSVFAVSPNDPP